MGLAQNSPHHLESFNNVELHSKDGKTQVDTKRDRPTITKVFDRIRTVIVDILLHNQHANHVGSDVDLAAKSDCEQRE